MKGLIGVNSKFQIAGLPWALYSIPVGFVSDCPGLFRNIAPHLSGKPHGNRTQMRWFFIRIPVPGVAGSRFIGSGRRDVGGVVGEGTPAVDTASFQLLLVGEGCRTGRSGRSRYFPPFLFLLLLFL